MQISVDTRSISYFLYNLPLWSHIHDRFDTGHTTGGMTNVVITWDLPMTVQDLLQLQLRPAKINRATD